MRRFLVCLLFLTACEAVVDPEPTPAPEPWVEPPVAPVSEPVELDVNRWWLGFLDQGAPDYVRDAFEAGTFDLPDDDGEDADGVYWLRETPRENGAFGPRGQQLTYWAVSELEIDVGDHVFARSTRTYGAFVGQAPQSGYFYGDRRHRIPVVARQDGSHVAFRCAPGREIEIQLYSTDDEVVWNLADRTTQDLELGVAEDHWMGVPLLNLTDRALTNLVVRVIENDDFAAWEGSQPGIAPGAVTQIPLLLQQKRAPDDAEDVLTATIRVASPELEWSYETTVEFTGARELTASNWKTYLSPVDGSVQRYGVRYPTDYDPSRDDYAMVLSLHGAGVQGRGQSGSYSAKDWAFIVAPTNRHEFGFDWEEWGRFNALATLDDAQARFNTDPTKVYLTGHSMGGHGTWHVGTSTPGRFATFMPSAGWESFYTYGGSQRPSGAIARSRAHSDTRNYMTNLARRGVGVIHGTADNNVPFSEGQQMYDRASEVTDDLWNHWQEGAGHWWDADGDEPGADCVDWEPGFEWMAEHTLDPLELEFDFRSANAGYSPHHSYVRLESSDDPDGDLFASSTVDGSTVTLETTNVRSMALDGAGLTAKGIDTIVVDGESMAVEDGEMWIGPSSGKTHDVHGPYNQVYRRPFCFVFPDGPNPHADAAAMLSSYFAILGNGHACGIPVSALTDQILAERNLIWMGVDADTVNAPLAFDWGDELRTPQGDYDGAMHFIFRGDNDRLNAVLTATPGDEASLARIIPFSSRSGMPDFIAWRNSSLHIAANMDAEWGL
jgi:poly(3-hydroxybutyrate) depolymerase